MSDYEYDIPMPENYRQLLLKLVDQSKKERTTTVKYTHLKESSHIHVGNAHWEETFIDNPFLSLDCYDLVKIYITSNSQDLYVLTPKAFKWAAYQMKNRVEKWWARLPGNIKDVMLAISFILALGLTALQILQALKVIPIL